MKAEKRKKLIKRGAWGTGFVTIVLVIAWGIFWFGQPSYCSWVSGKFVVSVENGDISAAKRYIRLGANVAEIDRSGASSLLVSAIEEDNYEMVEFLVKEGADANGITREMDSTQRDYRLHRASSVKVAKALVEGGADWKRNVPTLLSTVLAKDNADLLRFYLDLGVSPNMAARRWARHDRLEYGTLLELAVHHKASKCVYALVDAGAKLDGDEFCSPLCIAVTHGNPVMTTILLEAGADVNYRDYSGKTLLDVAAPCCRRTIQDYMEKN